MSQNRQQSAQQYQNMTQSDSIDQQRDLTKNFQSQFHLVRPRHKANVSRIAHASSHIQRHTSFMCDLKMKLENVTPVCNERQLASLSFAQSEEKFTRLCFWSERATLETFPLSFPVYCCQPRDNICVLKCCGVGGNIGCAACILFLSFGLFWRYEHK